MINFIKENFEGIIALIVGLIIPGAVFLMSYFQHQILILTENNLNKATQRLHDRINTLEDNVLILSKDIMHLQNLIGSLPEQIFNLKLEIEKLKK